VFREQANCFVKCAKIGLKNTRLQVTIREMQPKSLHFLIPIFLTCTIAGSVLAILAPLGTGQFSVAGIWVIAITISAVGALQKGKNNQPQSVEPLPAARPALLERLKPALRDSEIYQNCCAQKGGYRPV